MKYEQWSTDVRLRSWRSQLKDALSGKMFSAPHAASLLLRSDASMRANKNRDSLDLFDTFTNMNVHKTLVAAPYHI